MPHSNNGSCAKCVSIAKRFPGFSTELDSWFRSFQTANKDAHISCAGRGKVDQEDDFARGVSKAHWLESPHNFNAAIDLFRILPGGQADFSTWWYKAILAPSVAGNLVWGGSWKSFKDFPHVELRDWKAEVASGKLHPVE